MGTNPYMIITNWPTLKWFRGGSGGVHGVGNRWGGGWLPLKKSQHQFPDVGVWGELQVLELLDPRQRHVDLPHDGPDHHEGLQDRTTCTLLCACGLPARAG